MGIGMFVAEDAWLLRIQLQQQQEQKSL